MYPQKYKPQNKHWVIISALIILIVFLIICGLYVKQRQDSAAKPEVTSNVAASNQKAPPASTTSTPPIDGSDKTPTPVASTTLAAPSGIFVSNHNPNLSGSPLPSQESSVCNTSPGASCYISFTKDGQTKSVSSQTTDRTGSTSWNWDINSIGLTQGTWTVVAHATLDSQKQSTTDSSFLVVKQ